jgi:transposase-like protein
MSRDSLQNRVLDKHYAGHHTCPKCSATDNKDTSTKWDKSEFTCKVCGHSWTKQSLDREALEIWSDAAKWVMKIFGNPFK